MLNNRETYSSNEKEMPTSTFGGSFDKLAGEQQRIASQKNEGPSNIAESRISDAKWAELGGKPRNPTPEAEYHAPDPIPSNLDEQNNQSTEPKLSDHVPSGDNKHLGSIGNTDVPGKDIVDEEIEAGNGNLVSIGHKERTIPESGDITVSVGTHPATKGTSETPSEESTTTEAPIV